MKCSTYCGNDDIEKDYENCTSCPDDVGQCNGYTGCVSGNECEGGFCVLEVCWNKVWREGDAFCNMGQEENCKNSDDCACDSDELCSNAGICEKQEASQEEIAEAVQGGVQETMASAQNKQKSITFGTIGLIFLVVVIYIVYKIINGNKAKGKKSKKRKKK